MSCLVILGKSVDIWPSPPLDMMDEPLLDLHWNDYEENATSFFKACYKDQDFTDVILTTADDKQIKAHKIILSSCSQFFKNILLKNSHPNPLIYLKDMKFVHVKNLMELIYLSVCYVG